MTETELILDLLDRLHKSGFLKKGQRNLFYRAIKNIFGHPPGLMYSLAQKKWVHIADATLVEFTDLLGVGIPTHRHFMIRNFGKIGADMLRDAYNQYLATLENHK